MLSIDEVEAILDEIAETLPQDFYKELNGGILLLPEAKLHPEGKGDLYIMGTYHKSYNMGRYIEIYYGSFEKLYGHLSKEALTEKLRETLLHEFTHHLESLAGERGLEVKDAIQMAKYKKTHP